MCQKFLSSAQNRRASAPFMHEIINTFLKTIMDKTVCVVLLINAILIHKSFTSAIYVEEGASRSLSRDTTTPLNTRGYRGPAKAEKTRGDPGNCNTEKDDLEFRLLKPTEFIKRYGFPLELHKVVTKDGYILTIIRIPHGRKSRRTILKRRAVFLQHGFLSSSDDWIMNTADKAFPYKLADAGYDVWIGNIRGNQYTSHILYNRSSTEFWDFSWHEMGVYDIPACIDYITRVAGVSSIYYVGHSMGNNVIYIALSTFPEYNDKIRVIFSLAPAPFVNHIISPVRLISPLGVANSVAMEVLGERDIVPSYIIRIMQAFGLKVCDPENEFTQIVNPCRNAIFSLVGFDTLTINETWIPRIISHFPSATSTRTMVHFLQLINTGRFQSYDYGPSLTNEPGPYEYQLSRVTTPVALFWAKDDIIINPIDVLTLARKLPNVVRNRKVDALRFNHAGFMYGENADTLVYDPIIVMMKYF